MAFGGRKGTLSGNNASIPNPATATGSVSVDVGDLVFVVFGEQTSLTVTTCSDNLGNTYAATNAGTDAGTSTGRAYYSRVTVAGTLTTVSAVATSSADNYAAFGAVYEGPFPVSPLDANPANITSDITSPFNCPATGTLTQAVELVVAWAVATGSTVWAATSPNLLDGQQATAAILHTVVGSQVTAATTSVVPVFTAASNPTDAVLGTCSFKTTQALTPALYSDSDSFPVPTAAATYALTPGLVSDTDTFYAPTAGATYALTPSLYTDTDSFFAPTVTRGAVALVAALYSDGDTFFSPRVGFPVTNNAKLSLISYQQPASVHVPAPVGGALDQGDKQALLWGYAGIDWAQNRTLTAGLFSDGDAFVAPTVAATYALTPGLVSDSDTFLSPRVGFPVTDNSKLSLISYQQPGSVHTPAPIGSSTVLTQGQNQALIWGYAGIEWAQNRFLTPGLFSDGDAFYVATVISTASLSPQLFTNATSFYSPVVGGTYALTPALFTEADSFSVPTVTRGAVALIAALYTDSDTFSSPTIGGSYSLTSSLYTDADSFFSPTAAPGAVALTPSLYTDADTFPSPTVAGTYALTAALLTDADAFYSPVVGGAYALGPSFYSDADTFFAPAASATRDLTPALYSDADSFFAPIIAAATYGLTPALYSDADSFAAPALSGTLALAAALLTDADAFYSATVGANNQLTTSLLSDGETFFVPTVAPGAGGLTPSLYTDADAFFSSTVAPGAVGLQPGLYSDADTFFSATVAGSIELAPSPFSDADTFFAPAVATGDASLAPALYVDADAFFVLAVLGLASLTPALFADGDTFYSPIADGTGAKCLQPPLYQDAAGDIFYSASAIEAALRRAVVEEATVEAALVARLQGYAPLAALVGNRVYEVVAPQGVGRPFITLQETSATDPAQTLDGPSRLLRSVYQIDVYADGPRGRLTANQAEREVRAALDGYAGDVIKSVSFEDRQDVYDDVALHRVSSDFTVWSEGAP